MIKLRKILLTAGVIAMLAGGCSHRPTAVRPVNVDPASASRNAMETYDQDGDRQLGDEELKAVPGIAKYKQLYDVDGDGSVSQDEIAKRLRLWQQQGLGFRQLPVLVLLDGRPLGGAKVEFVPEPYLGPSAKVATGVTDGDGSANLSVARNDLPKQLADLPISGVTGGTFKVKVSHPQLELPAYYNTDTILGEEIAADTVLQRSKITLTSE